jgi:NhaP-type Na+/H+ or K+/H+ antiporter
MMRLFTHKPNISIKEQFFICYAGLIRGAIAFGLVLKLSNIILDKEKLEIIETTALTLVVSTTLIFGSTMSLVQKLLLPKLTEDQIIEQMIGESELGEDQAENLQKELESKQSVLEAEENKPLFSKGGHTQRPILPPSQPAKGNIN